MSHATLEIRAPAEQTEGTRSQLLRWLKRVGDPVAENEPLVELETDKVTVEIAAPAAGVLSAIHRDEQQEVEPGELLGVIELRASGPAESAAGPEVSPRRETEAAVHAARAPRASEALAPAVRRLLAEHGIDPQEITGSGPSGRLSIDDVLRHAEQRAPGGFARAATEAPPASDAQASASAAPEALTSRRVPHSAMRRRVAAHMVQSLLESAPHVTSVFDADLSAVLAHRKRHAERFERNRTPLTLTAYFVAAAAVAVREVPEANSRWSEDALEIITPINVGVATALGDAGLVVPVIHAVETLDLAGIAAALHDLVTRARAGALTPADVRGGTFTLSNHGVSGSLLAAPIVIPQPQSAVLGIGRLEKRAVVHSEGDEDRIAVRPKCYVTLTIDHRVMDGYQANRFLQTYVRHLEQWPLEGPTS
jgi:2-oxoglutarate dehydrogenase E2 component (dihydrolipoamide succinyltransferase)